ncbi:MAG: hypothetical protein B7X35_02505 [Halothiobacillus sp. 14-56-357]|nr:MAG: hypothetical protein B7X35_02505 [Halothiobacillus sp. 14-56-357]
MQELIQPVADSTRLEYDHALVRMDGSQWRKYSESHALGKRAASVLRAAWRRGNAIRIKGLLDTHNLLALTNDRQRIVQIWRDIQALVETLQKDMGMPAYQPPAGTPRAGKNSKRKSLRGLPDDWRDQLIEQARPEDQIPLLVMALTGCRPAELKKGILVMSDWPYLAFIIHGAKVKEYAGYEQRSVAIDPQTLLCRNHELIQMLFTSKLSVAIANDQSFQKRIKRLAQRLGFKNVSCYSLRHQLAADAKATGTGKTDLAKVLGHQAERTQRYYGNHQQGNKGGRVLEIHGHTQQDPRPAPDVTPVWNARVQWIEQKTTKVTPLPDHRPE